MLSNQTSRKSEAIALGRLGRPERFALPSTLTLLNPSLFHPHYTAPYNARYGCLDQPGRSRHVVVERQRSVTRPVCLLARRLSSAAPQARLTILVHAPLDSDQSLPRRPRSGRSLPGRDQAARCVS